MQGHWCSDMWVCGNLLMFVNFCRLARSCIVLIGRPMTLTSRDDGQTFAIQIRISYTFTGYCEMMKRNCHRSPTHTVLRWKRLGFSFSRSLVVVFLSCTQDVWANGSSCCSSGASTGKGEVEGCALYYPNDAPLQQGWITLDHAQKKHSKKYIYIITYSNPQKINKDTKNVANLDHIGKTWSKYHRGGTVVLSCCTWLMG